MYGLAQNRALAAVQRAIKIGLLPRLPQPNITCADCDQPATQYDHRDYSKPLKVTPVCRGCNNVRGTSVGFVKKECPRCGSSNILARKEDSFCRRCGYEWERAK